MANDLIVVESGKIECEHGGKVVLNSTVPNHLINGKKPLFDIDILGAEITGCPHLAPVGGNCTKVSSISSAVTESNVGNAGTNYLLRVDGCQTDKGAALVLVDPGQTNTHVSTPPSASSDTPTQKALEKAKLNTKENLKKEKYRIYPLRRSGKKVRALRGARDFQLLKNYYGSDKSGYSADKVVTFTDAYLYVKHNGKIQEYKVLNRGDMINPTIDKVHFMDTKTNIVRKYIPFYEESGSVELVYSNIKLTDTEFSKFDSGKLNIGDKKADYVLHPNVYAKNVKHDEKEFKKTKLISKDEAKKAKKRYMNILVDIPDPIGEVEDLYNEYESSYHQHYSLNKPTIDKVKEKNQYAYTVAEILDYLYVDTSEQKLYDKQRKELQEQYIILADALPKFGDYMFNQSQNKIIGNNLAPFIDYKVAKDYIDEVRFIDKSFFESISPWFKTFDEEHFYLYANKTTYLYAKKGYGGGSLFQQHLKLQGKGYKTDEKPSTVLAYLIFTIYFSQKHQAELDKYPELKAAANKFYFLLKKATPLPQINEKTKDEIHNKLFNQIGFIQSIIPNKNSLLYEYRELDNKLKKVGFDPKKDKKYSFKSLKTAKNDNLQIHTIERLKTPKELLKEISKALSSPKLKKVLENYKKKKEFNSDEEKYIYYFYLLNLSFMLIYPRIQIDEETEMLSPFAKANKPIQEFLTFVSKELQTLDEEMALKLHKEEIKLLYLKSLYSLISEAKLSKKRASNVDEFLKNFEVKVKAEREETSELLSQDFDKELKLKSESQSMFETLKKIDGVSSYLAKFEESEYDDLVDTNSQRSKLAKPFNDLKNSPAYKQLLSSTKVLSFFIAAGNIAEFMKGKEKLKLTNVVNLSQDILSVSSSLAEFTAKADHVLEQKVGKVVPKFTIPSSLDDLVQVNKVASPASMRVITRFGLVPVILNATIELSQIDREKNLNYFIAVSTKNAIYLAMLFTPATVGIGTIVLSVAMLELSWALLKDSIENSKIELFLEDSLLYEKRDSLLYRSNDKQKFKAPILLKAVNASSKKFLVDGVEVKGSDIKGFTTLKKLREFIAENYDANSALFDAALLNEISQLRSILYGYDVVKKDDYHSITLRYGVVQISPKSQHSIKLSSSLKSSAKTLYLAYKEVDRTQKRVYKQLDINSEYDITSYILSQERFSTLLDSINFNAKDDRAKAIWIGSASQTQVIQDILKDVYIIVVTPETTIRYNINYRLEYAQAQTEIYIKDIQATQLSQEDMKKIKEKND